MARKQKGSANCREARLKLARHYARIANIRADALHKLTTDLTRRFELIGIEDLNVKGMLSNRHLIFSCVDAGFTSVMIDASKKSYEENIAITREVVQYAHEQSVSVEAELGKIGGREENISVSAREASMTDPKAVPEFVSRTGIDALAVAIGTAHGFYKEDPLLDFERLEKIRSLTDIPLVLHGGTGLTEADFIHCVKSGISKINVGTELKYCCSQTIRKSVETQPNQIDIRKLIGPARKNCEEIVLKKIELFGSANKG